jgi:hypothetical protein
MFTMFRRPKPRFRVGQIVYVPGNEGSPGYYMQIRELKWVKQNGYTHWDWFCIGTSFRVDGTSLIPKCKEETHREHEVGGLTFI